MPDTTDIFAQGTLEMELFPPADCPPQAEAAVSAWSSQPGNWLAVVAAVFLVLLLRREYLRLLPGLWDGFTRWKGHVSLEHSVSQARTRNHLAACALLPFLLLADRYRLLQPSFLADFPAGLSWMALGAILFGFLLLRRLLYVFLHPARLRGEQLTAARRALYNHFLLLLPLLILSAMILAACQVPDDAIRKVLLAELAFLWLSSLLRSGQIFAAHGNSFATILYLCALELLPVGALVFTGAR